MENFKFSVDLDLQKANNQLQDLQKKIDNVDSTIDVNVDTKQAQGELAKIGKSTTVDINTKLNADKAKSELKGISKSTEVDINANIDVGKVKSDLKQVTKTQEVTIEAELDGGKINSAIEGLKGKFSDLGGGLNEAFGSLKGGDITGAFGQLTGSVTSFLGPVGLAASGVTALGGTLLSTVNEVSNMQSAVNTLTGTTGDALTSLTASIQATSATFGTEFNETLIATNSLAKGMGISLEEASKIMQDAFINGANDSGELLAQLTEYPGFFREAGYSAKEMTDYITLATKEGIFSDKGSDLVKEFGLRIREMTQGTKDALTGIGLSGDELQKQLKYGIITQKEAFEIVSQKLAEFPEQAAEVGTVIADVFGGPGEDAGLKFIKLLGDQQAQAKILGGELTEMQKKQKAELAIQEQKALIIGKITQALQGAITATTQLISAGVVGLVKNLDKVAIGLAAVGAAYTLLNTRMIANIAITKGAALAQAIATGATWLWTAAVTALNTAWLANPIGLVIAGVVLALAGAYLIFDDFAAAVNGALDSLMGWLGFETEAEKKANEQAKALEKQKNTVNNLTKEYEKQTDPLTKAQAGVKLYEEKLKLLEMQGKKNTQQYKDEQAKLRSLKLEYAEAKEKVDLLTAAQNRAKSAYEGAKKGIQDTKDQIKALKDAIQIAVQKGDVETAKKLREELAGLVPKAAVKTLDDYVLALVKLRRENKENTKEYAEILKKAKDLQEKQKEDARLTDIVRKELEGATTELKSFTKATIDLLSTQDAFAKLKNTWQDISEIKFDFEENLLSADNGRKIISGLTNELIALYEFGQEGSEEYNAKLNELLQYELAIEDAEQNTTDGRKKRVQEDIAAARERAKSVSDLSSVFGAETAEILDGLGLRFSDFEAVLTESINAIGDTFEEIWANILRGNEENFGEALKSLAAFTIDTLQVALIGAQTKLLIEQIKATATFNWVEVATTLAGIVALQAAFGGAKALLSGFKEGGFTSNVGENEIAGVVHGKEYVANAALTRQERPLLEYLDKGGSSVEYFEKTYGQKLEYNTININNQELLKELIVIKRASIDTAQTLRSKNLSVNNKIVIKSDYWR